jgi:hypothetical protein
VAVTQLLCWLDQSRLATVLDLWLCKALDELCLSAVAVTVWCHHEQRVLANAFAAWALAIVASQRWQQLISQQTCIGIGMLRRLHLHSGRRSLQHGCTAGHALLRPVHSCFSCVQRRFQHWSQLASRSAQLRGQCEHLWQRGHLRLAEATVHGWRDYMEQRRATLQKHHQSAVHAEWRLQLAAWAGWNRVWLSAHQNRACSDSLESIVRRRCGLQPSC